MDKFLIRDHDGPVIQLHSREELEKEIAKRSDPSTLRIWIFDQSEWMNYAQFTRQYPKVNVHATVGTTSKYPSRKFNASKGKKYLKRFLFLIVAVGGGLLVFNFTRINWEKQENIHFSAIRPANVPDLNIDSLISEIELQRGQRLDRSTRLNFRTRNTWPDRIFLNMESEHETSRSSIHRFSHINISIDNASGFQIDNAVVRFTVWKEKQPNHTDTLHFDNVSYEKPSRLELTGAFKGDSLSVSFESIRARSFNFCYSASTKNPGNYNDRWFCKDE